MVAIDRTCTFLEHFLANGFYAVNFLREEQLEISTRFAQLPEGRFAGIPWTPAASGSPILDGVLGMIDCTKVKVIEVGDHHVLIGRVLDFEIGEGRPLIFFGGHYGALKANL